MTVIVSVIAFYSFCVEVISTIVSQHVSNPLMFFIESKFYQCSYSLVLQLQCLCGTMGPGIVLACLTIGVLVPHSGLSAFPPKFPL